MKIYIGTKEIEAEPMTKGEAFENGLVRENKYKLDGSERNVEGYHVKYKDGYESWSPKETFEEAYQVADTPLERLVIEINNLENKMSKCCEFVDKNEEYNELNDFSRFLLNFQYGAMGIYMSILKVRHYLMDNSNNVNCDNFRSAHFDFAIALKLLQNGCAVARKGWNNKNLFAVKQIPAHIERETVPNMQSLPQSAKDIILANGGTIDYQNQCIIYNKETGIATTYIPIGEDLFADDWFMVIN